MTWCGHYGSTPGAPCKLESTFVVVFLIAALAEAIFLARSLRSAASRTRRYDLAAQSRLAVAATSLYGLQVAAHAAWLVVLLVSRHAAGFQVFSNAALAAAWAVITVLSHMASRRSARLGLRVTATLAVLLYASRIYTSAAALVAHASTAGLGVGLLATAAVQTALLAAAAAAEFLKLRSKAARDELEQALLADAEAPAQQQSRSWLSLLGSAVVYVWPSELGMQARVAGCVLIVVVVRVLNLLVPVLYRNAINRLAEVTNLTHPRLGPPERFSFMDVFYPAVMLYMVAAFLQGGTINSMGLLNNTRQYLFITVQQDAYRRISVELFSHTLHLDLKFHLMRKTGEITRQLDRGTAAIQNVLSTVVFNIGPSLFDIAAASVYVAASLNVWVAAIVFVTMASYIPVTIWLTEWRGGLRRDLNRTDNAKSARTTDALLNFETVVYFCNEDLEVKRYGEAVDDYQAVEWRLLASLAALNMVQTVIVWAGISCGLLVCVKGTASGNLTVGDSILFLTIMQQLYSPLNYFGSYYRQIQQYMIDMENMFALFDKRPSIEDAPDAKALVASGPPSVEFQNVSFSFVPGSPVLEGVSFTAGPGDTLALVGATGSGKSTIVRLVYRLYDPTAGTILINGQRLTGLRQRSVRSAMGMVPQDVVLFNDTVSYNIRYGRPEASQAEVEAAAKAACLHEAITERFPAGYATVVGERGLRLSGGEKQRVGVARAILRSPGLLLMDEATSALDSLTEQRIQAALAGVPSTRVIVAHRLSTIADATQILVLKEGRVLEAGGHLELMAAGGLYAEMWTRQAEASRLGPSQSASARSLASQA